MPRYALGSRGKRPRYTHGTFGLPWHTVGTEGMPTGLYTSVTPPPEIYLLLVGKLYNSIHTQTNLLSGFKSACRISELKMGKNHYKVNNGQLLKTDWAAIEILRYLCENKS